MGKEKRKNRLDKGTATTEFIGFSAFADPTTTASSDQTTSAATTHEQFWSPVYMGQDATVQVIASRITGKRDATTKSKALEDLADYLSDQQTAKPVQAQALMHYAWLYYHKLYYDIMAPSSTSNGGSGNTNTISLRQSTLTVWKRAMDRLPKVTKTLIDNHPQLAGLLYSASVVDPPVSIQQLQMFRSADFEYWDWDNWHDGIVAFVQQVLSYQRPSSFYAAVLEVRKAGSSDGDGSFQNMPEKQRVDVTERHERIVSMALQTLRLWLQSGQCHVIAPDDEAVDTKLWFKTLQSSKARLRFHSCQLLTTVVLEQPQLIDDGAGTSNTIVSTLAQAVASEKEASNLPTLLETLLTVLSKLKEFDLESVRGVLHKPLCKIWKKSCFGARVAAWGPTVLPLMAKLYPTTDPQLVSFVQATWEGRELTLGHNDRSDLLLAVVECTTFALLRKQTMQDEETSVQEASTPPTAKSAQFVAELWTKCWSEALSSEENQCRRPRMAAGEGSAHRLALIKKLATSLKQLEAATLSERPCDFAIVQSWFWETGVTLPSPDDGTSDDKTQNDQWAVTKVLEHLAANSSADQARQTAGPHSDSPFLTHVQTYFQRSLKQVQGSSAAVPNEEDYHLYTAVFRYFGAESSVAFSSTGHEDEERLAHFVSNDLLRWIVIHTSLLSEHTQSKELVRFDFELLSRCLHAPSLVEKRSHLWETVLREVVAATCKLDWLVEGILALARESERASDDMNWLRCASLDKFALEVAAFPQTLSRTTCDVSLERKRADTDEDRDGRPDFLRLTLGLLERNRMSAHIVDRSTASKFVDLACPQDLSIFQLTRNGDTVLLEILLEVMTKKHGFLLAPEEDRILYMSWLQGAKSFPATSLTIFNQSQSQAVRFLSRGSKMMRDHLLELCIRSTDDPVSATTHSRVWAHNASRLIETCDALESAAQKENRLVPSLSLVGLADSNRWAEYPSLLYLSTMSLLENQASDAARLRLVTASDADEGSLVLSILLSSSEASADAVMAARVSSGCDKCALFLRTVGGRSLDPIFLESLLRKAAEGIVRALTSARDPSMVPKCVAIISQLLGNWFQPVGLIGSDRLDPRSVDEGGRLWYIADQAKPDERRLVEVVKTHYDAQAGYYFTIRFKQDGENHERQTVAERLRRSDARHTIQMDDSERLKRTVISDLVLETLIVPFMESSAWKTGLAELVSIICCNVGLGPDRGVGTTHYKLCQLVKTFESRCIEALDASNLRVATDSLWVLSLSLGFGLNAPPREGVFAALGIDPAASLTALLRYYESTDVGTDEELDTAALAWLVVSTPHSEQTSLREDAHLEDPPVSVPLSLLFELVVQGYLDQRASGYCTRDLIGGRALFEGLEKIATEVVSFETYKTTVECAIREQLRAFASSWKDEIETDAYGFPSRDWRLSSRLTDIMGLFRQHGSIRTLFSTASEPDICNELSRALFVPTKRHYAIHILDCVALAGRPDFAGLPIGQETSRRVKDWVDGLEEEEAEEIEDDVEIVSRFLPRFIMDEIEDWGEQVYEETDETKTIGRFLCWLFVVRIFDVVAPIDFRFRPAFVSYLSRSGAADAALNLALLNDEGINDGRGQMTPSPLDIDELFENERLPTLANLSSLVLFCTVEVLPSISRRWWEESCPRVYANDVQAFVEAQVAPEILKRELDRIRTNVATFGEMSVRASAATRQVKATYVQDDFKLSVVVLMPAAFPFRSAEVDCSQTLGVPKARWSRWDLQITRMLNSEGGTLQDALLLWKSNVDKEFAGVEPCPVCYSVLHVKTHKLPSLECTTCNNRFHTDCLFEWFRSSGKNQCVLCQQPWQGTRVS